MNKFLKICAAIALLFVALSAVYYFAYFLPKQHTHEIEAEKAKKEGVYNECLKNCDNQPECVKYGSSNVVSDDRDASNNSDSIFQNVSNYREGSKYCAEKTNYGACRNECLEKFK